jgi:hypothetical protein
MSKEAILAGLCQSELDIAFVDETGTPKKPLTVLAGDFCLMCAVVVRSERYRDAKTAIRRALRSIGGGVREFHATEIVNPRSRSAWKHLAFAKRLEAFDFLSALLIDVVESVPYVYVSGEQYYKELAPRLPVAGGPVVKHKTALKKVFFGSLLPHLKRPNRQAAVVVDSETTLRGAIKIQDIRMPEGVYEGGVIHAESWVEEGLQLADLAAYTLNRVFHVEQRRLDGKSGPFDARVEALHERLRPKLVDLLVVMRAP